MTKDRVYVFNKGYKDKAVGVMPAVFWHGVLAEHVSNGG